MTSKEVENWLKSISLNPGQYFECSAKDSINVAQTFESIPKLVASFEASNPNLSNQIDLSDLSYKPLESNT